MVNYSIRFICSISGSLPTLDLTHSLTFTSPKWHLQKSWPINETKELCMIKSEGKQAMWSYLLSISQVSFKRPRRRQRFWVKSLILKTERIYSSLKMSVMGFLALNIKSIGRLEKVLGDLATVIEKEDAVQTNHESTLLLDGWPRTITETIATATRFMRFSWLIVLFLS